MQLNLRLQPSLLSDQFSKKLFEKFPSQITIVKPWLERHVSDHIS